MFPAPEDLVFFAARAAMLFVALLAFAFAFSRWRKAGDRDMQRIFTELADARADTGTLLTITESLCARLAALDEKLESRAQLSAAAASHSPRGYDLALRLARSGSAAAEIAETSGVTRQEAQLLARLHGPETTRLRTGT